MDELSQIFASPAATVVFFYCSLIGLLTFGATVVWLQTTESRRHLRPARQRSNSFSPR